MTNSLNWLYERDLTGCTHNSRRLTQHDIEGNRESSMMTWKDAEHKLFQLSSFKPTTGDGIVSDEGATALRTMKGDFIVEKGPKRFQQLRTFE